MYRISKVGKVYIVENKVFRWTLFGLKYKWVRNYDIEETRTFGACLHNAQIVLRNEIIKNSR